MFWSSSADDEWGDCDEPPLSENDLLVRSEFGTDESCVDYFSCAMQQTILMHGFMYITYSSLCFHSNILGIVTKQVIPLQDVLTVSETTQAFINPGILVCTRAERFQFFSFVDRDLALEVLSNIWQFKQMCFSKPQLPTPTPQCDPTSMLHQDKPVVGLALARWVHAAELRALCEWRVSTQHEHLCSMEAQRWSSQRWRELLKQSGPSANRKMQPILRMWAQYRVVCCVTVWREQSMQQLMRSALQTELIANLQYSLSRFIANPSRRRKAITRNNVDEQLALTMCPVSYTHLTLPTKRIV
eukprot:TRINITY_DN1070_c0_g1_i4.p1 TRINITY_DN1070_c0_g1~~TRINITY_DN1070_c0_g1_i4.p1  ORF type:complete len:300 (+),score=71.92 TRINITY_DN1070_c0_g1_i4:199-1098(+)